MTPPPIGIVLDDQFPDVVKPTGISGISTPWFPGERVDPAGGGRASVRRSATTARQPEAGNLTSVSIVLLHSGGGKTFGGRR